MKKNLLAVAVAAALVAAPAIATAQTTLFGQFKYEVGYIEDVAGDNNLVHSTLGTRLGVRGTEDLGGGLRAVYRFQGNFAGRNVSLANQSYSMNEEAWVGLSGGFGRVLLGRRDTAVKLASLPFRGFTDTLADASTIPARWGRAEGVHYTSPSLNGVTVGVTVEPTGVKTDAYYALNAIYEAGPLFLSAAYEGQSDGPGAYTQRIADQDNWQLGASWNFGQGDVGLLYQNLDGDVDVFTLPVNYKVTPNVNLRAAAQYTDNDLVDDSWTNFAIGAQYMFSNRTELFVNVWVDDVVGATLNPRNNAGGGGAGNTSDDSTHFGVGLRHSF